MSDSKPHDKIGVAVIGCGAVTELYHLPALSRVPKTKIQALCDINVERANELKEKFRLFNVTVCQDYFDALNDKNIDVVLIATPPSTHMKICIEAIKAGKHVYCEKPIATKIEDAKAIANVVKSSNVKFMMGFNFRFQPHFQKIKRLVEKGFVGKIIALDVYFLGDVRTWPTHSKFQFVKNEGGALFDTGAHCVDLALWLAGKARRVYANMVKNKILDIPVDDTAVVSLEHNNGSVSLIHIGWHAPSLNGVKVIGTHGILYATLNMDHVQAVKIGLVSQSWIKILLKDLPKTSYQQALVYFTKCIKEGKEPGITVDDGLRNLEILLAAYESARTGTVQSLEG